MRMRIRSKIEAAAVFLALSCVFAGGSVSAQGTCDAVANQVLVDVANPADIPAVAAQYGLNAAPIDQVGSPATYRFQLATETNNG